MTKLKLLAATAIVSLFMMSHAAMANEAPQGAPDGGPEGGMMKPPMQQQDPDMANARKEEQELFFKNRKEEMTLHLDNMIEMMQKKKSCVQSANSMQDLSKCGPGNGMMPMGGMNGGQGSGMQRPSGQGNGPMGGQGMGGKPGMSGGQGGGQGGMMMHPPGGQMQEMPQGKPPQKQ